MHDAARALARFLDAPSRANRDAVIAAHRYLCERGARKFRRAASDPADLEQVAAVGLIKATDAYRAERSTPFEAYAWLVIVGELMHYVRDHERLVRVPRSLRSLERRYAATWETLAAERGGEPTACELATALGVSHRTIEELHAMRQGNRLWEGDGHAVRPTQQWEAFPAVVPGLSLEERVAVLAAVDSLEQRERTIVLATFAAGLSQKQISARIGLSQSQVSKILGRALAKLHARVA
jgi:RNA polymerase sigma-B factor